MTHPSIERARELLASIDSAELEADIAARRERALLDDVQIEPPVRGIVRKTYTTPVQEPQPQPQPIDSAAWNRWCEEMIERALQREREVVRETVVAFVSDYVHQKLAALHGVTVDEMYKRLHDAEAVHVPQFLKRRTHAA